jgi:hypothetical protein
LQQIIAGPYRVLRNNPAEVSDASGITENTMLQVIGNVDINIDAIEINVTAGTSTGAFPVEVPAVTFMAAMVMLLDINFPGLRG